MRTFEWLKLLVFTSVLGAPMALADLIDEDEPALVTPPKKEDPKSLPKSDTEEIPAPAASATKPGKAPKPNSNSSVLAPKSGKTPKKKSGERDRDQPVHFESKGLKGLRDKGTVELVEDVVVTQGSLRMEADEAKVFYDEAVKDVLRVICKGNVKIFKDDEESGEKIMAYGDQVVFENKSRTVVLEGNARLYRGTDLVRGKKITYEMETGWIKADRVAGELHPPEDNETDGGPKK